MSSLSRSPDPFHYRIELYIVQHLILIVNGINNSAQLSTAESK